MKNVLKSCLLSISLLSLLTGCSSIENPACLHPVKKVAKKYPESRDGNFYGIPPRYSGWAQEYKLQRSDGSGAMGWMYFHQGNLKDAMSWYNKCWELNNENCSAYWGFGIIRGKQVEGMKDEKLIVKYLDQSIGFLKKAIALAPELVNDRISLDLANAYTGKGVFYLIQKNRQKANLYFKKSETILNRYISKVTTYGRAYFLLSACLYYQGRNNEAVAYAKEAEKKGFKLPENFKKDLKM